MSLLPANLWVILCFIGLANLAPFQTCTPQQQGIEGYVLWISGNQMPAINRKPETPRGIETTLFIFESTNLHQVVRQGNTAFYAAVQTKLVKTISTDSNGYFKVQLPVGHYSLFTKKGTLFYANSFDSYDTISPAEVNSGIISRVDIRVDYNAVY